MKNVLLLIITVLGLNCYSQNPQNANWYFGNSAGLNFATGSPVALTNSAMVAPQSCASISDQNGNILFYTNGEIVWNKNHVVMQNGTGLLGYQYSTQGVIIVPKPGSTHIYYIFTIDGQNGERRGLRYHEVDMSLASGAGAVTSLKNIPLKDGNNTDIDSDYDNTSEKLTSTIHSDGVNYWVVTQMKSYICSYLVSSAGVNVYPVTSPAPVTLLNATLDEGKGLGNVKISPNTQRIAIVYRKYVNPGSGAGGVALGSFNNSNGTATLASGIITFGEESNFWSIEFSPNSQNVYFGSGNTTFHIHSINLAGVIQTISSPIPQGSFQLANDGKIYMANDNSSSISVISTPDNFSNPTIQFSSISLGGKMSGTSLPQWIYGRSQQLCDALVLNTEPNTSYAYNNKSTITVQSAYALVTGTDITMKAQDYILLKPNTVIKNGSKYLARIEACADNSGRYANIIEEEQVKDKGLTINNNLFSLYPNPASATVTLTSSKNIKTVTVTSIDGKLMFSRELQGTTTFELDIRNYISGYYAITVMTQDGTMQTEKLIKN